MIAINMHKIDSTLFEMEIREKEYIPAPLLSPRAPSAETFDHLPYSPVDTCVDSISDSESVDALLQCIKERPIRLKI